jgi:hypothetical protein
MRIAVSGPRRKSTDEPFTDGGYASRFIHPDFETWDDLRVSPFAVGLGSAAPDLSKITDNGAGSAGLFTRAFVQNQADTVYVEWQMPHGWKQGTSVHPHMHVVAKAAGTVRFEFEWSWSNINAETLPASTLQTATLVIAAGDVNKQLILPLPTLAGTGKEISSIILARITRDNAVGSNLAGPLYVLSIDAHIQLDGAGSDQMLSKTLPA